MFCAWSLRKRRVVAAVTALLLLPAVSSAQSEQAHGVATTAHARRTRPRRRDFGGSAQPAGSRVTFGWAGLYGSIRSRHGRI